VRSRGASGGEPRRTSRGNCEGAASLLGCVVACE
jgi:hypothetical protein